MEIMGFIIMMVGMAGMDTEGNMWYLAAAMILVGIGMIYAGIYKERREKCHYLHSTAEKRNRRRFNSDMKTRL